MVAILWNIRSRYNVGSIFRTADAAGIEKLYLCGITPAPVDRFGSVRKQVAKVALGAENHVNWEKVKSAGKLTDRLKKEGYKVFAVEQNKKAIPYFKFGYYTTTRSQSGVVKRMAELKKIALVFGNEVRGLPTTILKKCDKILEIPMRGRKESLNVAVAFGIIVFHFANIL